MIKSVMGLKIDHFFIYDRALWKVISFPTRHSVVGRIVLNTRPIYIKEGAKIKVYISEIFFDEIWNCVLFGEIK